MLWNTTSHAHKQNISDVLLSTYGLVLTEGRIKPAILLPHVFGVIENGMQGSWHQALRNIENLYNKD